MQLIYHGSQLRGWSILFYFYRARGVLDDEEEDSANIIPDVTVVSDQMKTLSEKL